MKIIDDIENGLFLASSKLPNAGVGLFTSKFIMEGVPVCEYKGDVFNNQDEMYKSNRYNYTLKDGVGLRSEYSLKHSDTGKIIDCLPWATKSVMGLGGFSNDACNHEVRSSENYLNKKKEALGYTEERPIASIEEKKIKDSWELSCGWNVYYWSLPKEDYFYLISLRNIEPGEEIFANYGENYWMPFLAKKGNSTDENENQNETN